MQIKIVLKPTNNTNESTTQSAFIDIENRLFRLADGTTHPINPMYLALNDSTCNKIKYRVWLVRKDCFNWKKLALKSNPEKTFYAREEKGFWITFLSGQTIDKDQVVDITPSRNYIACNQIKDAPSGILELTKFVWETEKFYFHENAVHARPYKYPKKDNRNYPLGCIYENDEIITEIYTL